ncbi:MAG: LysR substrate-binding domain-containing protein [Bacteroidales bacterium]|nr:LysR substrate-binding domain-containing protein [Bacteroidales bacterium]
MMDFRLKVFQSVVRNQSFTRAAKELKISQPAISKHIQELESLYQVQLLERNGSQLKITPAGELLLSHSDRILDAFEWLNYDMNRLTNKHKGSLRLGASSTLTQYVLPPIIASFIKKFPEIKLSVINGNSQEIETALLKKKIDIGMVEGDSHRLGIHYTPFLRDELVAICSTQSTLSTYEEITIKEFKKTPIVVRENGSGTLEVLENALKNHKLKLADLNVILQLGSTESIKLFLQNSDCLGFVSIYAISDQIASGKFQIIDIVDFEVTRMFQFIQRQGDSGGIAEDFIRFARRKSRSKSNSE